MRPRSPDRSPTTSMKITATSRKSRTAGASGGSRHRRYDEPEDTEQDPDRESGRIADTERRSRCSRSSSSTATRSPKTCSTRQRPWKAPTKPRRRSVPDDVSRQRTRSSDRQKASDDAYAREAAGPSGSTEPAVRASRSVPIRGEASAPGCEQQARGRAERVFARTPSPSRSEPQKPEDDVARASQTR